MSDDGAAESRRTDDPVDDGARSESDGDRAPTRTVTTHREGDDVVHPDAAERTFGWRGDVLLVTIFLALIVAPIIVYLRPPALSWRVRLLLFPLLPGFVLAIVAVWATTRP